MARFVMVATAMILLLALAVSLSEAGRAHPKDEQYAKGPYAEEPSTNGPLNNDYYTFFDDLPPADAPVIFGLEPIVVEGPSKIGLADGPHDNDYYTFFDDLPPVDSPVIFGLEPIVVEGPSKIDLAAGIIDKELNL